MSVAGRDQCERLREALRELEPVRCLVSPMRRCLETREIAAASTPFEIWETLREVDFGDWEGKTLSWLELHEAKLVQQRRSEPVTFRPPNGESFADVAPRLRSVVEALQADRRVLVVGHRGTLGVLERLLRGLPLNSPEVAGLEPGEFRVV